MRLWDSRADDCHYTQISWQSRTSFTPGLENVKSAYLVDPQNILSPSLHIKLGFMKNHIKALNKNSPNFKFLQIKFSRTSEAKLRTRVFDGLQVRELTKGEGSTASRSVVEKKSRKAFRVVISNFLEKYRSSDYKGQIKELLEIFQCFEAQMSVKTHFLC